MSTAERLPRLQSIDLLRGLVIVIMALDHVRDFFTEVRFDPLDLTQTTAGLFLTRWITHFCAPVFVFLAGTGAYLSMSRGKSKSDLSKYLLTRGLWLIILELTWVRFGWLFNLDYTLIILQVIWVIGVSMVVLAGLIFLPIRLIAGVGIGLIAFHNLFDAIAPADLGMFGGPWMIMHVSGMLQYTESHAIFVGYPIIPWLGVMAAGYAFGIVLQRPESERRQFLVRLGITITLGFVLLRATNLYGDMVKWEVQQSFLDTLFSFVNCTKYPPSLLFLMMTMGPAIISLAYFERVKGRVGAFFVIFGRVPFFFYMIHIPLIHALAVFAASMTGYDVAFMFSNVPPWFWPDGYGFSLAGVYAIWIGVVGLLYFPCQWFADLKRKSRNVWLSYF